MKYLFLMLSNQPYESDLKTNKWHVGTNLAKRGHKVVFIDPPLRFKALKTFLKNPQLNLFNLFFSTKTKENGLVLYSPANSFNFWPFSALNTILHTKNIKRIIRKHKSEYMKVVLWIYHFDYPDLDKFIKNIDHDLVIYDCVDEYTAFPEYSSGKRLNKGFVKWIQSADFFLRKHLNRKGLSGKAWVLHREKWLSDNSNLLFVSSAGLLEKFKKWRDDVHYLPNACNFNVFDVEPKRVLEPLDIKNIPHPRIGFTGAIDTYKNNIQLIEKCAVKYPNYQFVMIGPEKLSDPDLDLSYLKNMANVHFLGAKPWKDTYKYFAHFDCYFIPYNLNEYTKGCFPVKYFESLAAGLPTVVTNMSAYKNFDPDGYVSKNDEEFIKNVKKALDENSIERVKRRKLLAKENTWDNKVKKQLALIDGFFKKGDKLAK